MFFCFVLFSFSKFPLFPLFYLSVNMITTKVGPKLLEKLHQVPKMLKEIIFPAVFSLFFLFPSLSLQLTCLFLLSSLSFFSLHALVLSCRFLASFRLVMSFINAVFFFVYLFSIGRHQISRLEEEAQSRAQAMGVQLSIVSLFFFFNIFFFFLPTISFSPFCFSFFCFHTFALPLSFTFHASNAFSSHFSSFSSFLRVYLSV